MSEVVGGGEGEGLVLQREEELMVQVYQRFPLVAMKGRGALLWDERGKEYLDLMGGYGVALVGHSHPRVVKAIQEQAQQLIACHGSLYNPTRASFLEMLARIAPKGLTRIHLSSSGAEAVETAIKMAKRFTGRKKFVAAKGSYHGKTHGALSATWNPKYRTPFEPLLEGFDFVGFGDAEALNEAVKEDTAAVILEPIQGESGIHLPSDKFLKVAREACDRAGALLILDEIQSGLGRTGRMWASEYWGVVPDILCIAKGLAGGLPIGATLARGEVALSLKRGEHTSTFGGNPLVCAAGVATITTILEEGLVDRAAKMGTLFMEGLKALAQEHELVREVRGKGLMLAMELRFDVREILLSALRKGLLLLYSGRNTLRFLPPLVIEEGQVSRALELLDEVLTEEERRRRRSS